MPGRNAISPAPGKVTCVLSNKSSAKNAIKEDVIKYETNNPVSKALLKGFFNALEDLLGIIDFNNIYEAGCGNGYVTRFIKNKYDGVTISASDISENKISLAKREVSNVSFSVASIYETKQYDNAYDLVIATEVLEHLEHPREALLELIRISGKHIIVSVPNEPIWRIGNMLRLKYLKSFGNTPGHINHWSKNSFIKYIGEHCTVKKILLPPPWVMVLCEK